MSTHSKTSWNVMPENEKLFWKEGSSNIIPHRKSLIKYARLIFPEDIVQVLITKEVPKEWTEPYNKPTLAPIGSYEVAVELKKQEDHAKKAEY